MTNLFEKALLTGFGIFVLLIFLSTFNPFLEEIVNFYNDFENQKLLYNNFINNMDTAINRVIDNPDEIYSKKVNYPKDLNISFSGRIAKFEYFIQYQFFSMNKEYSVEFVGLEYQNIIPDTYNLTISYSSNLINVSFN